MRDYRQFSMEEPIRVLRCESNALVQKLGLCLYSLIFLSPAACRLFSRGLIFTRARVLLALLSLRKNGGLLVVYY